MKKLFDICFGRWICAWCGKDMGDNGQDTDSSTICEDCIKEHFGG